MRILFSMLLLLAISGFGIGDARAMDPPTGTCTVGGYNYGSCTHEEAAYQQAAAGHNVMPAGQCGYTSGVPKEVYYELNKYSGTAQWGWRYSCNLSTQPFPQGVGGVPNSYFTYSTACAAGSAISKSSGKCTTCSTRAALGSGTSVQGGTGLGVCNDGCMFQPSAADTSIGISFPGETQALWPTKGWKPSGATCTASVGTLGTTTNGQACKAAPNGQTYCVREDGKLCATASTGRQVCWSAGETGTKTDKNVAQKRDPGSTATPPATPTNGDTLTQSTTPQTSTAKTGDGRNIITTITNYTTGSGGDAGSRNDGQPADGTGDSGDGDGKGTASGGEDCTQPLTVSGGDPVLAEVAKQSYLQRCGKSKSDADGDGQPDWTQLKPEDVHDAGEGAEPGDTDVWGDDEVEDGSGLDSSGWLGGSNSCPLIMDQTSGLYASLSAAPPQVWCDFVYWCRLIFIALATGAAILILGRG